MSLTDKQKRFCEEYMIDLNAKQAAIRVGYSEKTAKEQASRLLTNVNVQEYVQELKQSISERNKITVDECVQILANIARNDMADFYDENGNLKSIHDIPKESRDAIEELAVFEEHSYNYEEKKKELVGYTKKIKSSGKQGAIDKLLKHLGGYEKDNDQKSSKINIFELPDNGRG